MCCFQSDQLFRGAFVSAARSVRNAKAKKLLDEMVEAGGVTDVITYNTLAKAAAVWSFSAEGSWEFLVGVSVVCFWKKFKTAKTAMKRSFFFVLERSGELEKW